MSSIIRDGDTYHGISVFGRGVFTNERGWTYAGQIRDGYACGLGVATWSDGTKEYAEHGPDGECDGRCLYRWTDGDTLYRLYGRGGKLKGSAYVYADGHCKYNAVACAPDDPRFLALIVQVAPVEVRPAAPAPHPPIAPHSLPGNRLLDRPARLPTQALAKTMATEVQSHAARRPWWPRDPSEQRPQCTARPRSAALTCRFDVGAAWEAPWCTVTTAAA